MPMPTGCPMPGRLLSDSIPIMLRTAMPIPSAPCLPNVEVYLNSLVAPITKAKLAQGVANYVDDYGYSDEVIAANPEVASMEEVSLFPNPATDHFKVVSRSTAIAAVRIYTPSGTLVQQSPVYANEQVVPVSGLNKGLYLVEVRLIDGSKQVVKLQL